MNSRERVAAALRCEQPDRVPYCELGIDRALAQKLMGWGPGTSQAANLEANVYTIQEATALAAHLKLDNLAMCCGRRSTPRRCRVWTDGSSMATA